DEHAVRAVPGLRSARVVPAVLDRLLRRRALRHEWCVPRDGTRAAAPDLPLRQERRLMRPPAVPSRRRDLRLARFAPGVPAAPPAPATATGIDRFAADVGHFLSQSPRQLPSR